MRVNNVEWVKLNGRVSDWSNLHEISNDICEMLCDVYVYLE